MMLPTVIVRPSTSVNTSAIAKAVEDDISSPLSALRTVFWLNLARLASSAWFNPDSRYSWSIVGMTATSEYCYHAQVYLTISAMSTVLPNGYINLRLLYAYCDCNAFLTGQEREGKSPISREISTLRSCSVGIATNPQTYLYTKLQDDKQVS
jgi:hypothetical protein